MPDDPRLHRLSEAIRSCCDIGPMAAHDLAEEFLRAIDAPRPEAEPYTPKVGDVVRFPGLGIDYVVTRTVPNIGGRYQNFGLWLDWFGADGDSKATYIRPATAAERIAAGLDAAPVAERGHFDKSPPADSRGSH